VHFVAGVEPGTAIPTDPAQSTLKITDGVFENPGSVKPKAYIGFKTAGYTATADVHYAVVDHNAVAPGLSAYTYLKPLGTGDHPGQEISLAGSGLNDPTDADVYVLLTKDGVVSAPLTIWTQSGTGEAWDWDGSDAVAISDITLPFTAIAEGETKTLTATIIPANATWKNIVWTVTDGTGEAAITRTGNAYTLTGKAVGTVTVTAAVPHAEGGMTAKNFDITVNAGRNLKEYFNIPTTADPAADVRATFEAVHNYLTSVPPPQVTGSGLNMKIGDIGYGAWIDLDSLSIDGYPMNDTSPGYGKLTDSKKNLRLIVVGIKTFNGTNGNGTFPHLVFQFKDIPVTHRMNKERTNDGGYAGSEGRAYLIGNFQAGLKKAGVPFEETSWIWAPTRGVAKSGYDSSNFDYLTTDQLWLPTEIEIFGKRTFSSIWNEPPARHLKYYTNSYDRQKIGLDSSYLSYWTASPAEGQWSTFCYVSNSGGANHGEPFDIYGFAPAFCVK
jgi:hypothetical protein